MAQASARTLFDGSTGAVVGLARMGRRPARWSIRAARSGVVRLLASTAAQASNPLDVLVPHQRRIEVPGPWQFIRERAGVRPPRSVKDPPRLSVECTVLDLTDVRDAGEVVELVTTAVQRRLTTVKRLRQDLDARARHGHRALLMTYSPTLVREPNRRLSCGICATSSVHTACPRAVDNSRGQVSPT